MKPTFNKSRPLSWSAISSFEYDKEQWYRKYVLNEPTVETKEMKFGKDFALSCEKRKPLAPVTLLDTMEYKFEVVFNSIPMIGYADTFCGETKKVVGEFKTGKKKWDARRADEHGQITLYALFNFIQNKIRPEETDFFLEWIPTEEKGDFSIDFVRPIKVHKFKTKRSMEDILHFGLRIKNVVKEMEEYCQSYPQPSPCDILPQAL